MTISTLSLDQKRFESSRACRASRGGRTHTNHKSNISLLTSTLIRQDGQLSLHSAPCFVNKPSRHFLQYEWRHGKTLGSLYSSKQTAHSNSFTKFWAKDEAFAIVQTSLFWTEIGMEVSFAVWGKRRDCLWKCKVTRVELLVFSNTTQSPWHSQKACFPRIAVTWTITRGAFNKNFRNFRWSNGTRPSRALHKVELCCVWKWRTFWTFSRL